MTTQFISDRTLQLLVREGVKSLAIAITAPFDPAAVSGLPIKLRWLLDMGGGSGLGGGKVPVISPQYIDDQPPVDALVVARGVDYNNAIRAFEQRAFAPRLILPHDSSALVPGSFNDPDAEKVIYSTVPGEYIRRSGLRGGYAEFGVFFGRSFFRNYVQYHRHLSGRFYAFDSFAGLSSPLADETRFTDGDFKVGAYHYNRRSFELTAELVGVDPSRLAIVEGFYDRTLRNIPMSTYGIEPGSLSVCYIDCDLFDPTLDVLRFIKDALEPGGLLYFDDWRLCRASNRVGERAAALHFLRECPDVELVEFHRDHWQHQWFIVNKG